MPPLQDTRVGDFSCAVSAAPSIGPVACNTFLLAKYNPAQPSIYDREYAGTYITPSHFKYMQQTCSMRTLTCHNFLHVPL